MVRTYLPPKCAFKVEGNHIVSLGDIRTKVSGTSMAGVLGVSPYTTPFQVACSLLGLCREDISNKPAVKVGVALEEKIIRYLGEMHKDIGLFMAAEEVYEKREGDHDSWVSDFDDEYFAGHVDGIVTAEDGDHILEIKTTGNPDLWIDGVPIGYYWQISLYNEFITKKDMAYVGLGIVDQNTYRDPNSWVPNKNTVGLFEMPIDRADVREKMDQVREWYDTYVAQGVTPDYDPSNEGDVEMFEHLKALVMDMETAQDLMDKYWDAEQQLKENEKQMSELTDTKDNIKAQLKDYLLLHNLANLTSKNGECYGVLTSKTTKSYDYNRMAEDGIDISKYLVETETKTFTIKKSKKKKE